MLVQRFEPQGRRFTTFHYYCICEVLLDFQHGGDFSKREFLVNLTECIHSRKKIASAGRQRVSKMLCLSRRVAHIPGVELLGLWIRHRDSSLSFLSFFPSSVWFRFVVVVAIAVVLSGITFLMGQSPFISFRCCGRYCCCFDSNYLFNGSVSQSDEE